MDVHLEHDFGKTARWIWRKIPITFPAPTASLKQLTLSFDLPTMKRIAPFPSGLPPSWKGSLSLDTRLCKFSPVILNSRETTKWFIYDSIKKVSCLSRASTTEYFKGHRRLVRITGLSPVSSCQQCLFQKLGNNGYNVSHTGMYQ